jgi:phosphotransferase system  glucose/maltose/N-acetylglucosamine-specific IIC component
MDETLLSFMLIGAAAGMVAGAVPAIVGALMSRLWLGIIGFLACAVAGAILGLLLAVPVAAVFTWLIVRKTNKKSVQSTEEQ